VKPEADHIRDLKGQRQHVQVNVTGPEMAEAAEAVGIDIFVTGRLDQRAAVRVTAQATHVCYSLRHGDHATVEDTLRAALEGLNAGAHFIYCSLSPPFIEGPAREGIPVCAHAGLVPLRARLTSAALAKRPRKRSPC
jgi:3-methyl-2-oxobutanoate hydroxymethyltransferase